MVLKSIVVETLLMVRLKNIASFLLIQQIFGRYMRLKV